MTNYWKLLWRRVSAEDSKIKAELAQIAVLQQTAAGRRAEYARLKEQAEQAIETQSPALLADSRKRMEEAEAAHTAALQIWENKQSRQKSR